VKYSLFFLKIAKSCDLELNSTSSEEIYLKIDFCLNSKIILFEGLGEE
jgi:hypothetical protein